MKDFNTYSTYNTDLKLFKQLGFKPFKNEINWELLEVGKVKTDQYTINLSVMGCPAQFWTAKINKKEENETLEVTTGSGALKDFWSSIELIAQGMIGITILK